LSKTMNWWPIIWRPWCASRQELPTQARPFENVEASKEARFVAGDGDLNRWRHGNGKDRQVDLKGRPTAPLGPVGQKRPDAAPLER
jgi:hypothetical protein